MKRIAIIPTLLTLGNAVCGFASIACASKIDLTQESNIYFAMSGWFIIAAMVFDALDGYVARLARSASRFGAELDSLCDAISFGMAPAFLVMRMGPSWSQPQLHQALAVIAAIYLTCALMRLARFNVEALAEQNNGKRFKGLPSPGAAGCLAALAIVRGSMGDRLTWEPMLVKIIEAWATAGTLFVAILMVSSVPYPHLTKQAMRGKHQFNHIVTIVLFGFVIYLTRELALLAIFWVYAVAFPIRYLWLRATRKREEPQPVEITDRQV